MHSYETHSLEVMVAEIPPPPTPRPLPGWLGWMSSYSQPSAAFPVSPEYPQV